MRMLLMAFAVIALVSCTMTGQVRPLEGSTRLPAARGEVKISEAANKNLSLQLKVKHLAEPKKVAEGANTYVVWAQPTVGEGRAQNLGKLRVGKNLDGELETVVPFRNFNLFITAEPVASVTDPSGDTLMWTKVGELAE